MHTKIRDLRTLPYGMWYSSETQLETLFGRDYQPILERKFLTGHTARFIEYYPTREREAASKFRYGPEIPHDFAAWFYNDGNPPWDNSDTLKLVKQLVWDFLTGLDVRQKIYCNHRTFAFPDRVQLVVEKGKLIDLESSLLS